MAKNNNSKILQSSFYEIDILEIGGHHKGKHGKGSENKQPTLLVLYTLEDNNYPQYVKLHTLPNLKVNLSKNISKKNVCLTQLQ